jgi:hypothetical protein
VQQSSPFKPKATLLLDILPDDSVERISPEKSSVSAAQVPYASAGQTAKKPDEPEEMLKQLLINTEASAHRIRMAKMKWQFATLALGLFLVPATVIVLWSFVEMKTSGTIQDRLEIEKQALKEQLNTAGIQITGLKNELETLLNRNLELVNENALLQPNKQTASATTPIKAGQGIPEKKVAQSSVRESGFDAGRMEALRKGTYPRGTSKTELTAALGEPDRIYKSRKYEQFVYFNRNPGRFWFIGEQLVQTGG